MDHPKRDSKASTSARRWLRVLTVIGGLALLGVGVVAVMNLSAAKANGAPSDQAADGGGQKAGKAEGKEGAEDEEKKAPVPVEVTEVASGTVSAYITSTANLVAENQVKILSEVEGRVSKLLVEEGDFVNRGQVLATLVNDDQQIAVRKAELKESNARLAFERGHDLAGKELISREDFDRFTMDHEIARQELAEAQWALEKTVIRSPFGGQISERMIQVGKHVRPGDEMFQVTDFDPLIARIFLPERDVIGLEIGRQVRIDLNAEAGTRFSGRIRQVSPVVDTATGTVKVTIESIKPPASVRPGSFVTVNIVRTTREGVLLLPREAVLRELKSAHVFLAEDGQAVKRQIELGLEEGNFVEALSGVEAGEQVIVAGQGGLKDGSPVKILGAGDDGAESVG